MSGTSQGVLSELLLLRDAALALLRCGLSLLLLRRRLSLLLAGRARRFRLRRCFGHGAAFAVGEPDIVDRMLDRMQAGTRSKHPAGIDPPDLALQRHLVDFDEGIG